MIQFVEFPKIPRYRREVALTEKIDGTNAAVVWAPVELDHLLDREPMPENAIAQRPLIDQHGAYIGDHWLLAQSRGRFITPVKDNYGFAKWVAEHADELRALGPGVHYGEWWGYGIQRGYGMPEKHFSLFNVNRWGEGKQARPACCDVVPLLGYFTPDGINAVLIDLEQNGSRAAPGYMRPEGLIIWHSQSRQYYKILLERDDVPKSQSIKHKVQDGPGTEGKKASGGSPMEAQEHREATPV